MKFEKEKFDSTGGKSTTKTVKGRLFREVRVVLGEWGFLNFAAANA
jgi:hypothetical protein